MRRSLEDARRRSGRRAQPSAGLIGLHRQPLELEDVGQREREIERILAARDARIVAAQLAVHVRLLLGELLVKLLAELLHGDHEEDRAAAQRAHVVGQDLALPPRVQDVLPALRLLAGLHHVGVDEDAVRDHVDRHPGAVGLERGDRPAARSATLPYGWNVPSASCSAVVVEPLWETSPSTLPAACSVRMRSRSSLARASRSSKRMPYLASKAAPTFGRAGVPDGAVVDDDLAFLLRGVDDLLPLRVGGRLSQGRPGGGDRGDGGETKQGSAGQHRFSPWGRSITTARDGFAPVVARRNGTGTRAPSMTSAITLTWPALPSVHIRMTTTARTSLPTL